MEQVRQYDLTRAAQRLQEAVANVPPALLEPLQLLGDADNVRMLIHNRHEQLLIASSELSMELEAASQSWAAAIQHAFEQDSEETSRALVRDYINHWSASGGDVAESRARKLLSRLGALISILPQDNISTSSLHTATSSGYRPNADTPLRRSHASEEDVSGGQGTQRGALHESQESGAPSSRPSGPEEGPPHIPTLSVNQLFHDQSVRLPKFDLPVFTGDIAKFAEFWDVFDSAVHSNHTIPSTVKFHYLRTSLKGEALSMVAGFEITDANYQLAINILRKTYSRPQFLRVQLSSRLQQLRPATTSALNQRITLAQVRSLWLQLERLGDHDDNIYAMRIIRDKFPSKTLERVGETQAKDSSTWGVHRLLEALDQVIQTFEMVEDSSPAETSSSQALALPSGPRRPRDGDRTPSRRSSPSSPVRPRRSSPYPRSGRFRSRDSYQNRVETTTAEPHYVGDLVDDENEDYPSDSNDVHCLATHNRKQSSDNPRLMVVTVRARNNTTLADELLVSLLDSGAQHSFIKEDTAHRLGLQFTDPQCFTTRSFGGFTTTETSYLVRVDLRGQMNDELRLSFRTRKVTTSIRADMYISEREINLLPPSNNPITKGDVDVDVLIGIDHYWEIVDPTRAQRLPSGLTIVHTRFGPIISGSRNSCSEHVSVNLSSLRATRTCEECENSDPDIRQLWDLEFLGITDSTSPRHDDEVNAEVVQRFHDTVQVIDGIIHVQFPWKQHHPRLLDNKYVALKRLQYQYDALHDDEELWGQYCNTFQKQEQSGIIEEVEEFTFDGPLAYYMPHRAVIKADSATTAVRIVFDASSHQKGSPSLNDCLHQGPSLLPDLAGTLLRSREPRFLIISDVEKAFHQIRLQKD
ncbi:hypothetical protein V3C99_010611, partial [Haemonchus contortus]